MCDVSDADAPVWADPVTVPGADVTCLDAAVVDGRAVAATGGEDGMVCLWDVAEGRILGEPNPAHGSEFTYAKAVSAVRFTELRGRPVVIGAGMDGPCVSGTFRPAEAGGRGSRGRRAVGPADAERA